MRRSTRIKSKVEVNHGNSDLQSEQTAKKDLSQSPLKAPPDLHLFEADEESIIPHNDLSINTVPHSAQLCFKNDYSSDEGIEKSTLLKSNSISTKKSNAKKKNMVQLRKSSNKIEKLKGKSLKFVGFDSMKTDSSSEKELCKRESLNDSPITFVPLVSTEVKPIESINQLELNEEDILIDVIPLIVEKPLEFTDEKLTESEESEILEGSDLQSEIDKSPEDSESKFQSKFSQSSSQNNNKKSSKQTVNLKENVKKTQKVMLSVSEVNEFHDSVNLENNEARLKINNNTLEDLCLKPSIASENCSQNAEISLLKESCKVSKTKHVSLNPLNYVQTNDGYSSDLTKDAAGFKANLFLKSLLHNPKKSDLLHEKQDICGLDKVTLDPTPDSRMNGLTSSIQCSIENLNSDNGLKSDKKLRNGVEEVMKKSVLTSDLEKRTCAPKMFESKHSKQIQRKKIAEETAGKGWYNLPKTEITEEIKRDLQIIKMRGVLDSKHHYKRNDSNKLPKYFQIGTIVEGPHEFYNSRVPNKKRKATIVDELLDDAEFRRKNKKSFLQIQKKKMSGGKGFYKKKINKSKPTWART